MERAEHRSRDGQLKAKIIGGDIAFRMRTGTANANNAIQSENSVRMGLSLLSLCVCVCVCVRARVCVHARVVQLH